MEELLKLTHRWRGACPRCRVPLRFCFCEILKPIVADPPVTTPVHVLMHHRELAKRTASAYYIPFVLPGARVHLRGRLGVEPDYPAMLDEAYEPLVLFPSPGAVVLTASFLAALERPAALVVLDGTWGQARHSLQRVEALHGLSRVTLPPGPPSSWRLRRAPRPEALCTFEAISRALGIIEGPQVEAMLMSFFRKMVDRWLEVRGRG